jgi:hypothetical protein
MPKVQAEAADGLISAPKGMLVVLTVERSITETGTYPLDEVETGWPEPLQRICWT